MQIDESCLLRLGSRRNLGCRTGKDSASPHDVMTLLIEHPHPSKATPKRPKRPSEKELQGSSPRSLALRAPIWATSPSPTPPPLPPKPPCCRFVAVVSVYWSLKLVSLETARGMRAFSSWQSWCQTQLFLRESGRRKCYNQNVDKCSSSCSNSRQAEQS